MTLWADVDERVLRWVLSLPATFDPTQNPPLHLPTAAPEPAPVPDLDGLDTRQVDDSMRRLQSGGLIAGKPSEWSAGCSWMDLRVTAKGLQLFDEWPNFDQAASAIGMHLALGELAKAAPDQDTKSALERTRAVVAGMGDAVIKATLQSIAADVGGDVAGL